ARREHRRERCRPVVAVEEVVIRCKACRDLGQQTEAQRVVGPVLPARILVGIAVALVELRRAQQQDGICLEECALEAELAEALALTAPSPPAFASGVHSGVTKRTFIEAFSAYRGFR